MKTHRLSIVMIATSFVLAVLPARSDTPPAKAAADQIGPTWKSGLYVYDGTGNIWAIGTAGSPAGDGLYTTYTYDHPMSRLLGASAQRVSPTSPGSPHTETYRYDQYGNMTRSTAKDGSEVDFTIDAGNHLTGSSTQYDEAGNLVSYGGESYVYDAANMMVAKDHDTTWHDRYLYTADDQRIGARVGGKWTWTLRDAGQQVVRQYESSYSNPAADWTWVEDYQYGPRGTVAAQRPASEGALRHLHLDHLGTARLVTNAYGASISQHDYQPFGIELTPSRQEAPNREEAKKFTGHERDLVPDGLPNRDRYLDYMHARYYSPGLGRFISVDPTWTSADASKPQTWNRYVYVLNNPIVLNDPTGKAPGEKMDIALQTLALTAQEFLSIEIQFTAQTSGATPGLSGNASVKSTAKVDEKGTVTSNNEANAQLDANGCRVVGFSAYANYTTPVGSPTTIDSHYEFQKPEDKSQVSSDQMRSVADRKDKEPIVTGSHSISYAIYPNTDSRVTTLFGGGIALQIIRAASNAGKAMNAIDPNVHPAAPMKDPRD